MSCARISSCGGLGRAARACVLVGATALAVAVGWAATRERNVSLQATAEIYQWAGGRWEAVDTVRSSPSFAIKVADSAGGIEGRTDFIWNGTSSNGHAVKAGWGGPAQFRFNPGTGVIEVNVRLDFTIDGTRVGAPARLTTESIDSPVGTIHGERAALAGGSIAAGVVGTILVRRPDVLDRPDAGSDRPRSGSGSAAGRERGGNSANLLVVIKATGRTLSP